MKVINPATGVVVREVPEHDEADLRRALERAEATFQEWREVSMEQRAAKMQAAARVLRERRAEYAARMVEEMGKTLAAAEAEVDKCAWVCEHFATHAARYLAPETIPTDASESFVRFDPLGPILAVMPWNFPFWQVFRFAAPALMAGNVGLLKHASNVPGCAIAIEQVFREAGFPDGAFQTLLIPSRMVERVIRDPAVRAVTLTGSEPAGRSVASVAGSALKKTVLELGGSDAFIVLRDADLDDAVNTAVAARILNNGQSCIAAKRFIVEHAIADRFEHAFIAKMASLKVADPMDRSTDLGPLAREDLLMELHDQVQRTVAAGASLRLGGHRLDRPGFFYAPTVLAGVRPGMPAFDEETFGPVAAIVRANDPEDAIRLANQSSFGLGAAVFTRDLNLARRCAARIEAGSVFVNGLVKSDPRLPFGGVKQSGYGRELSAFGIREFVNIKTVWIRSLTGVAQ